MESTALIPKKIHYCWFGDDPMPESAEKCMETWKKYCHDYEINEWNESNFDINCCDYVREAYEAKKWAFVSDVARLYALVNHGGIYLDTDVELIKPLDGILSCEAFSGFEKKDRIATAVMACVKGHILFAEFLDEYRNLHFVNADGSYDFTPNVSRITNTCLKYGLKLDNSLQKINGLTLFPCDYFYPKDFETGKTSITDNTYSIHHYDGSWLPEENKYYAKLHCKYNKVLPNIIASNLAYFFSALRFRGIKGAVSDTVGWFKRITH